MISKALRPASSPVRNLVACTLLGAALFGCGDEQALVRLRGLGAFVPSEIDFGTVAIGTARGRPAVVQNVGDGRLQLESITLPEDFSLRGLSGPIEGLVLDSGEELSLDVVFLPASERARNEKLEVQAAEGAFELTVMGQGVRPSDSGLVVEPSTVDFGTPAIGDPVRRVLTVMNAGPAERSIVRAALSSASPSAARAFTVDSPLPLSVDAGGWGPLGVRFSAPSAGSFSGTLELFPADGSAPLTVGLRGQGTGNLGELRCTPASLDFGSAERGSSAGRSVRCSASGGAVRLIQLQTTSPDTFQVSDGLSGTAVADGAEVEIPLTFRAAGGLGPRRAQLALTYEDRSGRQTTRVALSGEVSEPSLAATAIALELTWDLNLTDVDIHLTAPGGIPVTHPREQSEEALDCSYGDLPRYGGSPDDWGTIGDPSDDCFLDRDDTDGMGPERINMTRAMPGTYRVYVHYFANNGQGGTTAEVKVVLGGQSVGNFRRTGLFCNEMWYVGEIAWNGTTGSFRSVDRVQPDDGGDCR